MNRFMTQSVNKVLKSFNLEIKRLDPPPSTYFEIDETFNSLYDHAQEKTQMSGTDNLMRRQRHYTLQYLVKQIDPNRGDIAECGCLRGLSAYQIATHLKNNGFKNKFYIFDSFEGLSVFEQHDISKHNRTLNFEERRKDFACPEDTVSNNLGEFDFIELKKGWIPVRFAEVEHNTFIFVHIDVDLYQPIWDSLAFFYKHTVRDGIIVFDDYGYLGFPGAKKAVDEFLADKNDFFLPLPSGQAFLIKR